MNRVKLLIVEDDSLFGWALKEIIARAGYWLKLAESGAEALDAVARESFDLVLQDIKLPDADGLDILREITVRQPRCGAIVMTGHGTIEDAAKAMKLGAFDFLTKPFPVEMLFVRIKSFFEWKKMTMARCSLLDSCYFFNYGLADMPCTTEFLKDIYCRGNYGECTRFKFFNANGSDKVPRDLSPNDEPERMMWFPE